MAPYIFFFQGSGSKGTQSNGSVSEYRIMSTDIEDIHTHTPSEPVGPQVDSS